MASVKNLIAALEFIVPEEKRDSEFVEADHDVIFLPEPPKDPQRDEDACGEDEYSAETKAKLDEFGAFYSDEFDCWTMFC